MKKLYAVLIVLVLLVVAVGFYRGWFALSSSGADKGSNKVNVNLTVDRDKMQEDAEMVKKKATELTDNVTAGEKTPDDPAGDNVKSKGP
jgi:cell division protein FtsX